MSKGAEKVGRTSEVRACMFVSAIAKVTVIIDADASLTPAPVPAVPFAW